MTDELPAVTSPEPDSSQEKESREATQAKAAAYQSFMQSTSRAVEDTSEQLRRLATLSTAASGVALRLMLSGEQPRQAAQAMAQAQDALHQATTLFQEIGRVSIQLLDRFQPPQAQPSASLAEGSADHAPKQEGAGEAPLAPAPPVHEEPDQPS